jgi:hypothetical protein
LAKTWTSRSRLFQPSPGPKAGRHTPQAKASTSMRPFQSSPGPKATRHPRQHAQRVVVVLVSIPARPESRAPRFLSQITLPQGVRTAPTRTSRTRPHLVSSSSSPPLTRSTDFLTSGSCGPPRIWHAAPGPRDASDHQRPPKSTSRRAPKHSQNCSSGAASRELHRLPSRTSIRTNVSF